MSATSGFPRFARSFLKLVLHLAQIMLTLGGLATFFLREQYMRISQGIFGEEAPLMNAQWVDLLIRPSMAFIYSLLVVLFLVWRYQTKHPKTRLIMDLGYVVIVLGLVMAMMLGLYLPVTQ